MEIQITVKDKSWNDERIVEVRRISTLSLRRLNGHSATQLLRREFPEVSAITFARKSSEMPGVFHAWHGIDTFDKSPATRTYELTEICV